MSVCFRLVSYFSSNYTCFNPQLQTLPSETGGRDSVVRASEFKSEDPGSDPLGGGGRGGGGGGEGNKQFFCRSESTLVLTCLCLTPPSCVWHAPISCCAHVKDPIYICRKRAGLTAGWYGNTKTLHTGKNTPPQKPGSTRIMAARFPQGKAARISRASHWDNKVNLI